MIRHKKRIRAILRRSLRYGYTFFKWLCFAGVTGVIGGIIGTVFHVSVEWATHTREHNGWLLWLLPLVGIIIMGLYDIFKFNENNSTDTVVKYARHDGQKLRFVMAPLIFVSTFLTHLCGGSAGREGAALQLGGSIGTQTARWFRASKRELRVFIMCGMSALFSALFGTPLTAVFFTMEVSLVGIMPYPAFIPCIISAVTGFLVTQLFKIEPTGFILQTLPEFNIRNLVGAVVLAVLCAILSICFCLLIRKSEKLMHKIGNKYVRAFVGGALIIALTYIVGSRDYNGAGMNIITRAVETGNADTFAFLLKILFTVITISAGFKGGEIVPTLFIGSTFGCVAGSLLGLDAGFGAALGMVGLFCGMLNCPIASVFLGIELFGSEGMILFMVVSGISYMLSGYYGLYGSQKIAASKLRFNQLSRHVNK